MKRFARVILTHPVMARAAFFLTRRVAPIFMMHRFRDEEAGNLGHDPAVLRQNLAWLRANKCSLLSLTELIDRLANNEPLHRAVVFTVDDGYADFARVAAPVFSEFDCPVTVFLTTGFLDGEQWMWWDKVSVSLTALGRAREIWPMVIALKLIPEAAKLERIEKLVRESGVQLPQLPPQQYAPIAWNDVRRLSRSGVTFGPHTVTHPVLSRTTPEASQFEIVESWRRVRHEAGDAAVPVFCYPNGERADFAAREENSVAVGGMRAALSTRPDYASHQDFRADHPSKRFRLPRFPYSEDHTMFKQVATGVERGKLIARSAIGQNPD